MEDGTNPQEFETKMEESECRTSPKAKGCL